jgi:hypothetical protein
LTMMSLLMRLTAWLRSTNRGDKETANKVREFYYELENIKTTEIIKEHI